MSELQNKNDSKDELPHKGPLNRRHRSEPWLLAASGLCVLAVSYFYSIKPISLAIKDTHELSDDQAIQLFIGMVCINVVGEIGGYTLHRKILLLLDPDISSDSRTHAQEMLFASCLLQTASSMTIMISREAVGNHIALLAVLGSMCVWGVWWLINLAINYFQG